MDINKVYLGDCLEIMPSIPDKSVDMILCDLPYGTTACKWDTIIPFEPLWKEYKRVIKDNGAIVLTASQPFTSALVMSNIKMFRYSLVWDKVNKYTGALNANKMPLRRHEDIIVFYGKLPTFNKQFRKGKPYKGTANSGHGRHTQYGRIKEVRIISSNGNHNPCSIIPIEGDVKLECGLHSTQKPVALFEYLIKTYTNEGDLVLDNCAGSFTTSVACDNLRRDWICIEKEENYCNIGIDRINKNRERLNSMLENSLYPVLDKCGIIRV